jgi:hypothetical protein
VVVASTPSQGKEEDAGLMLGVPLGDICTHVPNVRLMNQNTAANTRMDLT